MSEEVLAARVDTLVKAHLLQVTSHMLSLQTALASSGGNHHCTCAPSLAMPWANEWQL